MFDDEIAVDISGIVPLFICCNINGYFSYLKSIL